jgi:hypothetical protein
MRGGSTDFAAITVSRRFAHGSEDAHAHAHGYEDVHEDEDVDVDVD